MLKHKNWAVIPFAVTALALATSAAAEVKVSGQINRMVANIDNGNDSELQHLDNNGSGTRFRLTGAQDAGNGLEVGFIWESQYQSNPSNGADADDVTDFNDNGIVSRHRDLYIKGSFGKVSMGQGDGAANGITEMDYTGTTYLTYYASVEDIWGGVSFFDGSADTGFNVGDLFSGFDALSRNDRLRYDSPQLGPVTVSVDMGQGGKTEAAVRFDTEIGGVGKIKGGIGMWDQNDAGARKGTAGSIAFMHDTGFNAYLAFGEQDATTAGASDPSSTTFGLGYRMGDHSISVNFGTTDDLSDGNSADSFNVGYVNRSLKSTDLYAGLQTFSADLSAGDADDIQIVFAGARVRF